MSHRSDMDGRQHPPPPHPSPRSERALDWLNFFVADVETGFGPFISAYLASNGWTQGAIGLALSAGSLSGLASQLPGGAIVDAVRFKRGVVAAALLMIAAGGVILFLFHAFWLVLLAQVLHGLTSGLLTPSKAAIGLGLVGQKGLSRRLGRNHRYDSFGNGGTAALMGALGHFVAQRAAFLCAVGLCAPALWALFRINRDEIDYSRARAARPGGEGDKSARYRDLLKNRQLLVFAGVVVLFQLANASAIPLVAERLGQRNEGESELVLAGLIVVPQVVTAILAPWAAQWADDWGRKPLLLAALAALALRVLLFTVVPGPLWLLPAQVLSGIDATVIGILVPLIIADLMEGTGRYNLAQGAIGLARGLGAALSTAATGYIAQWFGFSAGLLSLAAVAAGSFAYVLVLLRESRPGDAEAADGRG